MGINNKYNFYRTGLCSVTNRGDTLSGSIKNPLFEYQLFSRIVLKNDEKQSFGPSKVRFFVKDDVLFESHDVGDNL